MQKIKTAIASRTLRTAQLLERVARRIQGPTRDACPCGRAAELWLPVDDDGAIRACWTCAHLAVDHEIEPTQVALTAALDRVHEICRCSRDEIYPTGVPDRREGLH